MIGEKIKLFEDRNSWLQTYINEDVEEYQTGRKRPAVVICPGGGYWYLSEREAEPIALKYMAEGYQAFVLHYSTGWDAVFPASLQELSKAVSLIRENKEQWMVLEEDITVVGFSAGAHLAVSLAIWGELDEVTTSIGVAKGSNRANQMILGYPMLSGELLKPKDLPEEVQQLIREGKIQLGEDPVKLLNGKKELTETEKEKYNVLKYIGNNMPPTFLWTTDGDKLIPKTDSLMFVNEMQKHGNIIEFHMFYKGNHGLALANDRTATSELEIDRRVEQWFDMSITWLKEIGGRTL